jgi:hypothetical protein
MRKLLGVLTMILAGLFVAASPAGAAPARPAGCADDPFHRLCLLSGPTGWTRLNIPEYHDCDRCHAAGRAGVRDGRWPEYRCGAFPIGLDIVYYIYIPPQD